MESPLAPAENTRLHHSHFSMNGSASSGRMTAPDVSWIVLDDAAARPPSPVNSYLSIMEQSGYLAKSNHQVSHMQESFGSTLLSISQQAHNTNLAKSQCGGGDDSLCECKSRSLQIRRVKPSPWDKFGSAVSLTSSLTTNKENIMTAIASHPAPVNSPATSAVVTRGGVPPAHGSAIRYSGLAGPWPVAGAYNRPASPVMTASSALLVSSVYGPGAEFRDDEDSDYCSTHDESEDGQEREHTTTDNDDAAAAEGGGYSCAHVIEGGSVIHEYAASTISTANTVVINYVNEPATTAAEVEKEAAAIENDVQPSDFDAAPEPDGTASCYSTARTTASETSTAVDDRAATKEILLEASQTWAAWVEKFKHRLISFGVQCYPLFSSVALFVIGYYCGFHHSSSLHNLGSGAATIQGGLPQLSASRIGQILIM